MHRGAQQVYWDDASHGLMCLLQMQQGTAMSCSAPLRSAELFKPPWLSGKLCKSRWSQFTAR